MHEERVARTSAPWIETPPLSPESAASVRAGALAVLRPGVRYLPVVEDGTLVGLVAVGALRRPRRTLATAPPGGGPAFDGGDGHGAGITVGGAPRSAGWRTGRAPEPHENERGGADRCGA
jgi:hypothetical protein